MPEFRMIDSIKSIGQAQWDACFVGDAENYGYLLATEEAGLKGFAWGYVTAWENDRLIAAMPGFFSDYELDTTLQGTGKKITTAIKAKFPNLLKLKLACLGSPCTEGGNVGFHSQVKEADKSELLRKMLIEFERVAAERGCKLIGLKDIPETMEDIWKNGIEAHKYAGLPGMPTAYLDIDFATLDEYFTKFSYATRKNMRRKVKVEEAVRIETTSTLSAAILPQIMALYHDTRNRSEWQFEELTESYFEGVLKHMPDRSFCNLYYVNDQLLAANLLVHDGHTLLDKFFCMNSIVGREYNLYFLSWFTNVRTCLEHGIKRYQSGQANYENKLRLGSKLTRNNMYFKHRNGIAQSILKFISPFLAADETLKDQKEAA